MQTPGGLLCDALNMHLFHLIFFILQTRSLCSSLPFCVMPKLNTLSIVLPLLSGDPRLLHRGRLANPSSSFCQRHVSAFGQEQGDRWGLRAASSHRKVSVVALFRRSLGHMLSCHVHWSNIPFLAFVSFCLCCSRLLSVLLQTATCVNTISSSIYSCLPGSNMCCVLMHKCYLPGLHRGFAFIDFASATDASRFMDPGVCLYVYGCVSMCVYVCISMCVCVCVCVY